MVLRVVALLFSVGLFGTYVVYGAQMFVWLGLVPKAAATAPATTSPTAPGGERHVIMAGSKSKAHVIEGQRVTYGETKIDWSGPVMGGSKSAAVVSPTQLSGANLTVNPPTIDRSVLMLGSKSGAVAVQPQAGTLTITPTTQPPDRRVLMPDSKYLVVGLGQPVQNTQEAATPPPPAVLMGGSKSYSGLITVLKGADGNLTVVTPTGAPAAATTRPVAPATGPVDRRILMPSSKDIILTPQK